MHAIDRLIGFIGHNSNKTEIPSKNLRKLGLDTIQDQALQHTAYFARKRLATAKKGGMAAASIGAFLLLLSLPMLFGTLSHGGRLATVIAAGGGGAAMTLGILTWGGTTALDRRVKAQVKEDEKQS